MMCKINYFSANEPLFLRYARRLRLLPASELFHRGTNLILKKIRSGLLAFPQNIHIEITNHCNLNCPMCPYSTQSRPKGFIEFNLFRKIVNQCKGQFYLEKMALMGLGEPFLHPEIIEMSRYAKAFNIRHVFTSTNATLLDEKEAKGIISKPGFDLLAISLDGASKDTYENIRKGANFDKVIANVMGFIKIRRSLGKKKPRLVLQFLIMKENYHEKDAFVKFWKDKLESQDTIFLRDVDAFGGQVPDCRLIQQLPRIKRRPCIQLWRDLIISWQGDVSVCCKDVNYRLKVGNVNEATLKDIWVNLRWSRLRDIHKKREWDKIPLCSNCSEWNQ